MTEEQEVRQITVPKDAAVLIFREGWLKKQTVKINLPADVDLDTINEDSYTFLAIAIFAILYYDAEMTKEIRQHGSTLIRIGTFLDECKHKYLECERARKRKEKSND